MWIFGYASLVWKTGFDYDERRIGFIKGYRRAFHLACFEHRGTEELPARVATLEPDDEAVCWGVAFCVKDDEAAEKAMSYLHVRESEYDIVKCLEFFTDDSPEKPVVSDVLVFMSTLDKVNNKYYLGVAPRDDIAMQIATAKGPCGHNSEYLFCLAEALREIGHEDGEVNELVSIVRGILISSEQKGQSNQSSLSPNSKTLFTSQNIVSKALWLVPSPVQGVTLNYSPRLLKSEAQ